MASFDLLHHFLTAQVPCNLGLSSGTRIACRIFLSFTSHNLHKGPSGLGLFLSLVFSKSPEKGLAHRRFQKIYLKWKKWGERIHNISGSHQIQKISKHLIRNSSWGLIILFPQMGKGQSTGGLRQLSEASWHLLCCRGFLLAQYFLGGAGKYWDKIHIKFFFFLFSLWTTVQ